MSYWDDSSGTFGYSTAAPTAAPPLWAPHYRAPLPVAVGRFFRKYAVFHGRASRTEYWWWLVDFIAWWGLVAAAVLAAQPGKTEDEPGPGFYPGIIIILLWLLATIAPNIAVTVRRLHDANLSGWICLLLLIPYLGALVIAVLALLPPRLPRLALRQAPYDGAATTLGGSHHRRKRLARQVGRPTTGALAPSDTASGGLETPRRERDAICDRRWR